MAGDLAAVLDDLRAESAELSELLADAGTDALSADTPAAGWTVGDTVGHLWFFDVRGYEAITDPDAFTASLGDVIADPQRYLAAAVDEAKALGADVVSQFGTTRAELITAVRASDPAIRVPWYGPSMSLMSFTTARLMETWAHGQDIADALGLVRQPTTRLRHICHLGVRTRGFSYAVRGMTTPEAPVYVRLVGPDGQPWEWGEPSAPDRVEGPALDFCLLVTQRRHLADLDLAVMGQAAAEWLSIAQAFAGTDTLTDPSRAGLAR